MVRNCPKCSAPVPDQSGAGRPAVYCSVACRRLAEYEIRQLRRLLDNVREQISWCYLGFNFRTPAQIPGFEAEVERLEARLRALLAGEGADGDRDGDEE